MTPEFLAAVADTIFPGEALVPSATRAGLRLEADAGRHAAVLARIASAAGGEAAFVAADAERRSALLEGVDARDKAAFRALVAALSARYFGLPGVLEAYGWPARAPQPDGFALGERAAEPQVASLLARVAARPPIWRRCD